MKLLHTSDWHLGLHLNNRSIAEDQEYFVNQICKIIKENDIDAVLLAGDVFDRSMATGETISLYDSTMTKIVSELNTAVLSIAGNHDGAERLSQCHELLKNAGLYIAGSLSEDFMVAEFDDTDIYLVPWFSIEKARSVFHSRADEILNLEDAWRVVCDEIKKTFKKEKKHILVTHAFIVNAETSVSDKAAEIGTAAAVGKSVFEGFDYVALGHIHKPQIISETIRYCGTPMPYSFGKEEKQEKGVVVIDTSDMSQKFIPLELLHKMTTIKGSYDEILKADYPDEIRNGYVKLEVSDSYIGPEALSLFSERYPLMIDAKGKDYNDDSAEITMSIEDLQNLTDNPSDIFKQFCNDTKLNFTEDRLNFFKQAMDEYMEEADK